MQGRIHRKLKANFFHIVAHTKLLLLSHSYSDTLIEGIRSLNYFYLSAEIRRVRHCVATQNNDVDACSGEQVESCMTTRRLYVLITLQSPCLYRYNLTTSFT